MLSGPAERDLVIDLPTCLSCSILSDWVSTVDLARFDSAYCYHAKRGVVLDMFQSNEFLSTDNMQSYDICHVSSQYWDWILRRDIKLFYITVITTGVDEQKLDSYAKRHERHIGHLDLANVESSSFALHCKHVVELTCNMAPNPSFETLLQNNPNLQILDLRGLLTSQIELFKTTGLPHLTQLTLDAGRCSAELVAAVLTMPARLLKLDILNIYTDLTGVAKLCPHLRSLSLDTYFYKQNAGNDFDLIELTSNLPHLVNLQFMKIIELEDTDLLAVVQNLKQLRFLSLQFLDVCNLTDAGIEHITEHCAATLEVFSLGISDYGAAITHISLDLLRARCTKLRQFHIKAHFEYSDILLCSVTTLVLYQSCEDSPLVEIANECPQLEVLQLKGGANVCTLPTLRELCQKCPKLRRIEVDKKSVPYWKSVTATLPQLLVTDHHRDCRIEVMKMPI